MTYPRRFSLVGLMTGVLVAFALLLSGPAAAYAENKPLDCSKKSLRDAVRDADETDRAILFTGVCSGPIVIRTDGLTLTGVGTAIIDGGSGDDAVTIMGARGVALTDIEVRNG